MKAIKSKDKVLLFYPDLWHDVLHEPEFWGIFKRVLKWCNERTIDNYIEDIEEEEKVEEE
jgi:alpha-beta hydrolase superfamily lysophospholipase